MGWTTWQQFRCNVDCVHHPKTCTNEGLIVGAIDHLAADGWKDVGYEYVHIDDCWMASGRVREHLAADKDRFPHGIQWLADYAHKKNVKLGLYLNYGLKTNHGFPGSVGHLADDAADLAEWGIDYVILDAGYNQHVLADAFPAMSVFLNKTGRPVLFTCGWPSLDRNVDWNYLAKYCNMWRYLAAIKGDWLTVRMAINKWGKATENRKFVGPGHWNDPNSLVIGMQQNEWTKTLTEAESRTQFSIWAILAAPLIMSNDLSNISSWAKDILTNKEVIAVDQDKLGSPGERLTKEDVFGATWVKKLENGDFAIALQNGGDAQVDIRVNFSSFSTSKRFALRDLWLHKNIGTYDHDYVAKGVPPHDVVMLRATPK
jgi:hypothetical protein